MSDAPFRRRVLELAQGAGWLIVCPACRKAHFLEAPLWRFNGDMDRPSFEPDQIYEEFGVEGVLRRCHFCVSTGRITYFDDCTHLSAGLTVELPEI